MVLRKSPFYVLAGSAGLLLIVSGFSLGTWYSNFKRISESPLYAALLNAGISVNIDGINCQDKASYGLFDSDNQALNICLTPHDEAKAESVLSTLRHEGFHVLQACYNSKEIKLGKDGKILTKGVPKGSGTFFSNEEFKDYFKAQSFKDFLGEDVYEFVIGSYDKEKEAPELEARASEIFFGDQQIAWWISSYCKSSQ